MAKRFFDQLGGIIGVKIRGEKQEKIINMALSRGIYIWDIKKDYDSIILKVKASGYEALKNICDENGYVMETTVKQGFPFFKGVFKRRLGFLGGALIFVAALYLLSSFIWFVEVSGNRQVDRASILNTAAKYGVYEGAARWGFSRSEVEKAMLKELSQLAYVKVDIKGVKANIEVVEKVFPQNEINGACHMVAAKSGIIKEVLVLDGQAAVKEGDVVARGDILISGIVFPSVNPFMEGENLPPEKPYQVRARGSVKAQINYQGYGECRLKSEKTRLTG
ncbi:MAG: sporulation protein YqfD, partial [Syntrophomonas sp.]